eukprot:1160077-Pelagomonas_calceolata.AAC.6
MLYQPLPPFKGNSPFPPLTGNSPFLSPTGNSKRSLTKAASHLVHLFPRLYLKPHPLQAAARPCIFPGGAAHCAHHRAGSMQARHLDECVAHRHHRARAHLPQH